MFGKRYLGRRWFGEHYFGTGGDDPVCEYFFTNFEADSLGDTPAGWTARGPSGYASLAVANDAPPFKRRVATLASEDGATAAFSIDAVDAFGGRANADIVLCVERDASNDHERIDVYVRGQGSGTITDGYIFGVDFTNDRIRIYKLVGGSVTTPFADLAITHAAGDFMLYRLRITGGATTTLKARTWSTDESEPATWGLTETDSSSPITAAGWIGIGGYVPSGLGESTINFVSVAAGGCSAPAPILDNAFVSWLNDPTRARCVLADLMAVGYDAVGSPTATKTVYARMATRGFNTTPSDDPPSTHYRTGMKLGTLSRTMNNTFQGKVDTSLGAITIPNPSAAVDAPGARDNWLRAKWKRDYVTLWIGDPEWPKASFRKFVVGILGQPALTAQGDIQFSITDIIEGLNRQLQTETHASGQYAGKLKPLLFGDVVWMEPVPVSDDGLTYQLNDGAINRLQTVFDNGVPLTGAGTISAVDTGTNTLTAVDPHGLSEDSRVVFDSTSHAPSPLIEGVSYYVIAAGLTANDFRVAATRGGAEIDITTTGSGTLTYTAKNWWEDLAAGTITLVEPPVGRITAFDVAQSLSYLPGQVVDAIVFDRFGWSRDLKDQDSFDELDAQIPNAVGALQYDPPVTALAMVDRVQRGIAGWYGSTLDGLVQVGVMSLPAAVASMEFAQRDVEKGSLRQTARIMPINKDAIEVRVDRRYVLNGAMALPAIDANRQLINQPYDVERTSFSGSGTPLDDYPDVADVRDFEPLDSVFSTMILDTVTPSGTAERLATLFGKTLGVFRFKTRLRAMMLKIGDTIQLEYPRLGWKQWDNYDPASPDNTADIDSTKAVVMGIEIDLASPFPVTLTVYRQIPGYYPEEDFT